MENTLLQVTKQFEELLTIEYLMIIGRKGKAKVIHLTFNEKDFFHLAGLHKLSDISDFHEARNKYFERILAEELTENELKQSKFYSEIEDRLWVIDHLQNILDSNVLVFRFNRNRMLYSEIHADYLLEKDLQPNTAYIFLVNRKTGKASAISCFTKQRRDYSENQEKWTLLYKEKIYLNSGEKDIQYSRLTDNEVEQILSAHAALT